MRVLQPLLLAALLSPASAEDGYLPPSTGKFFYADIKFTDIWKDSYAIETAVGSSRAKLNLRVNTWQSQSTIFTSACPYPSPCNIQGLYNLGSSKSKTLVDKTEGTQQFMHWLADDKNITVTGTNYKDEYIMKFDKWGRMSNYLMEFLAVDNVDQDINFDDFQGMLGLAPYAGDIDNMEKNFMWQLKDQGIIDHMVFSFYVDGDDSFIKFGSYDPLGVKSGQELQTFHTWNVKDWTIWLTYPKVGNQKSQEAHAFLEVNPAWPFLYISTIKMEANLKMIQNAAKAVKLPITCTGFYCKVDGRKCSDVTDKESSGFDARLEMGEIDKTKAPIVVKGRDLLIDSQELGLEAGSCILGIFLMTIQADKQQTRDTWTLGSKLFKDYYFVFDQTGFNERGTPNHYIGIGERNPRNVIGEQHYDPTSPDYSPEDDELDQSIDMDGFEDPYESLAFWLRDNKGLVIFLVFLFVFILCCVAYIVRVQLKKKKSYTFRLYSENLNKSGIQ